MTSTTHRWRRPEGRSPARRHGRGARLGSAWLVGLVGLVGLFGLAVGCSRREASPDPIRIGFLVDRPTPIAQATLDVARLAVETVNAAGGIDLDGRPHDVALLIGDTGNTPEGATRASLELINRQKVVAIVGSSFSRHAIPSGAVAEKAGIPMICPGSTHPQTTAGREFLFRVSYVNPFQGRAMARFARQDLALTTAAVLYDVADANSRDVAKVFQRDFAASGGRVVALETFTTGETDFSPALERIRAAAPEALFLPNFSTEVVLQGQQARGLGIESVLLGTDSWLSDALVASHDLEGGYFSLSWHRDMAVAGSAVETFDAGYLNADGGEPYELAAMTYDAFGLLFQAIATAAETEPESIREALARIEDYRGVTGPITFSGTAGDPHRNAAIVQLRDGRTRLYKVVAAE